MFFIPAPGFSFAGAVSEASPESVSTSLPETLTFGGISTKVYEETIRINIYRINKNFIEYYSSSTRDKPV